MPELIAPTTRLHEPWLVAHREWGAGLHEDGFGLLPSDEVDSAAGFAAWVARLTDEASATPVEPDGMRGACWWIVEDDQVLGGIALRDGQNDFVRRCGHIGYGIRPSARRRGVATWALRRVLAEARDFGLDRVLLVCESDNTASATTIERNGGVLEPGSAAVRRYRITLPVATGQEHRASSGQKR